MKTHIRADVASHISQKIRDLLHHAAAVDRQLKEQGQFIVLTSLKKTVEHYLILSGKNCTGSRRRCMLRRWLIRIINVKK